MEHLENQLNANPNMRYDMRRIEREADFAAKTLEEDTNLITIPVIIHVVYSLDVHNISDEQIYSQLRVLNEDFLRKNEDRFDTDPRFLDVAASSRIRFQLADIDPQGNPTTGITRHKTKKNLFYSSDNAVKYSAMGGVDAWPTTDYLNIWICNLGSGILGYSQFPGGPSETDGVVIGYRFFGTMGTVRPPFNQGRTTTHEIGHWLNLRHIWGDGPCGSDDHVDDTPLADRPHHGCLRTSNSCGSADMVQNFMDYTDDACMNLFSQGQATRMRALFVPGGHREPLLHSPAIVPVEPEDPPFVFFPPAELQVEGITASTATLKWEDVEGAEQYRVRVRRSGQAKWYTKLFDKPFVNTNKLRSCTNYEFQVESVASEQESGFSEVYAFQTQGCAQTVADGGEPIPTNLHTTEVMGRQATINWNPVVAAQSYEVQYKQVGTRKIYTKLSYRPATVLYGLTPGVRYIYRVRAKLEDGPGKYSKVGTFVPGSASLVSRETSRLSQNGASYLRVFPDRREGVVSIEYDLPETDPVNLSVWDAQGNLLKEHRNHLIQPGVAVDLNLSRRTQGRYMIQVEDADGFQHVKWMEL